MMMMNEVWKDVGILGQGSFGVVRLFANQVRIIIKRGRYFIFPQQTGEQIALKEMKVDLLQDLDHTEREKTKMRLINEVKIMWEHDHDNLVRALCSPQVSESGLVPVMYLKWNGYNNDIDYHRLGDY